MSASSAPVPALEKVEDTLAAGRRIYYLRVGAALAGLLVIVIVVNAFTGGSFLSPGNIINVLRQITYNAILAIGQTFVIITTGIDLSIGSLVSLCGVVMAIFANASGLSGVPLIVATAAVGVAIGGTAGLINALPVVKLRLPPFITTLAMMLMARGLAYNISGGRPVALASDAFTTMGIGFLLPGIFGLPGIPVAVIWMAAVAVLLAILLGRTRFGRYVYALGGNEEAARLAGVPVGRIKTLVYVISGACAGIASLLLMARFSSGSPQTGYGFELPAIAAAVVGGTSLMGGRGLVIGTFFGALLIGVLNNVMNLLHIQSYTQEIVLGGVILIAVILDELRKRFLVK